MKPTFWNHQQIQALGELLRQQAAEIASHEEAAPVLFIIPKEGEMEIVGIILTELAKATFQENVAALLRAKQAIAYCFVCEGWATRPQSLETINRITSGDIAVSELPPDDRFEILIFNEVENGQPARIYQSEIKRGYNNVRIVQPWTQLSGSHSGRMMVNQW